MAYNFFDLGIKGSEIKRRLDLLRDITNDDCIVIKSDLEKAIENMQINKADKMTQTDVTSNSSTYIQTNSGKIDFELYTYKHGRLASGAVKIENKNILKEENYTYHFDYEDTDTNLTKYKPGQTY